MPGKIDSPLNKKLSEIKWGEFNIESLFKVQKISKMLSKEDLSSYWDYPVYSSDSNNNGIIGYTDKPEFICDGSHPVYITFGDHTRTFNIAKKSFSVLDNVKVLLPAISNINVLNFIISVWYKQIPDLGYSRHWKVAKKCAITLPITNRHEIDFNFIDKLMAELEMERLKKLETYLKVTGLDDYAINEDERNVLERFSNIRFKAFNVADVFDIKNTHNILSSEIIANSGATPYLCASAVNNSVDCYISYNENLLEHGNCIFIGGKTFVVSYQEKDFFSNDSHNLILSLKNNLWKNKLTQLYLATCIRKSLSHKYSWDNSVSNRKIQKDIVFLPAINNKVDYGCMANLISAILKLVIKDVVLYTKQKINAYKDTYR